MQEAPKVSICIPVYNRPDYIAEAIESVLNQTFADFEIIVTDNCSTDNTPEVIKGYVARDKRVLYHKNKHNIGGLGNLNGAILLARGEYIKSLFSDDKLAPQCLEIFVETMDKHPDVSLITSFTQCIGDSDHIRGNTFFPGIGKLDGKTCQKDLFLNGNWPGSPSSTMFRHKDLYIGLFNHVLTAYCDDLEMWIRLLGIGDAYVVPQILSYLRIHNQQVSATNNIDFAQIKDRLLLAKIAFFSPHMYGNYTKIEQKTLNNHLLERLVREGIGKKNLRYFLMMIKIGFSDLSCSHIKFCLILLKNLRRFFKKTRFSE